VIVDRYASLVYSVCRQYVTSESLVDDAFQETFVVLAQRAHKIRSPNQLSSWLYGVAMRTSRHVMRRAGDRGLSIVHLPSNCLDAIPNTYLESSSPEEAANDARTSKALNEELERLPDRYRSPLVLCYLMGETHGSAAQKLGVPRGSIAQRVRVAKQKLQTALRRRGIALSLGALALLLSHRRALAQAPPALVHAVIDAVSAIPAPHPGVVALRTNALRARPALVAASGTALLCGIAAISWWLQPAENTGPPNAGTKPLNSLVAKPVDGAKPKGAAEQPPSMGRDWARMKRQEAPLPDDHSLQLMVYGPGSLDVRVNARGGN
jgi:RNA polymerase sigma factor (sigma-70 family)